MLELESPQAELAPVVPPQRSIVTPPGSERRNSLRRRSSGVSSAVVAAQPRRRSLASYQNETSSHSSFDSPQQSLGSHALTKSAGRPRRASAGLLDAPGLVATLFVSTGVAKWDMGHVCCVAVTKASLRRLMARLEVLAKTFRSDLDSKAVIIRDEFGVQSLVDFEKQCAEQFDAIEQKVMEVASFERRSSAEDFRKLAQDQASKESAGRYKHEISRLTAKLQQIEKQRIESDRRRLAAELRLRVLDTTPMCDRIVQTEDENWQVKRESERRKEDEHEPSSAKDQ